MALTPEQLREVLSAKKKILPSAEECSTVTAGEPSQNQFLPGVQGQSTTGTAQLSQVSRDQIKGVEKEPSDERGTTQKGKRTQLREGVSQTGQAQTPAVRTVRGEESSNAPSRLSKPSPRSLAVQTPSSAHSSVVPQAPEIELAVLAALYQYPAVSFPIFTERGRPEFFFNALYRSFFSLLLSYFSEHQHLDPNAFLQNLLDSGQLDKHGGSTFLSQVLSATSPPSSFSYHLDILRDKYIAREATRLSGDLARKAQTATSEELSEVIAQHEASIAALRVLAADKLEGVENFAYSDLVGFDSTKDATTLIGNRWLCRGFTCLWAAPAGIGKSSLEMQLAIYWASGAPCFGIKPVRPLKSLIVQAENDIGDTGEQLQGVLAGIKSTGDLSLNGSVERMIVVVRLTGCVGMAFLSTLSALLKLHKPDMVWIDPLFAFAGCNLLDAKEVGLFLREGLIPLTLAHGVCTHVIHHASKTSQDSKSKSHWSEIDYQYLGFGSSEIQNSFRAVNVIVPVSGQENLFRLILSKRGSRAGALSTENEPSNNLYLSHSKEGISWLQADKPEDSSEKPKRNSDSQFQARFSTTAILEEMTVLDGWTATELQQQVKAETGMSEKTFYRLWSELKSQNKIKIGDKRKWYVKSSY